MKLVSLKLLTLGIIGTLVLGEIFIFNVIFDPVILLIWGLWFFCIWLYRLRSAFSVVAGLFFLVLCPILLIFEQSIFAEKVGNWAFLFLITGVAQALILQSKQDD